MTTEPDHPLPGVSATAQAVDGPSLERHFGGRDVLPLWIAEPYVPLAPEVVRALSDRAATGWYGYETRPAAHREAFAGWMSRRHGWDVDGLRTIVSPSVGTSIGVLLELTTAPGDGVILQPPVFTDFKPLVTHAGREVVKAPLRLDDDGYAMDLDVLEQVAAASTTTAMILCNPHNPVGRVWTTVELAEVAAICARHDVFVIADEIHADLTRPGHPFVPFATVAPAHDTRWAATHGPIKTFGLAGVCDTVVLTDDPDVDAGFGHRSSQLHLTRNHVLGLAAWEAAYGSDGSWLDGLLAQVADNVALLADRCPAPVRVSPLEGTYLAWLDLRGLGMDVPELTAWLGGTCRVGTSPGHWFGREGAGFARLTVAAPHDTIAEAADRLAAGVAALGPGAGFPVERRT